MILHAKRPESDHRPIAFNLTQSNRLILNQHYDEGGSELQKYKWRYDKIDEYQMNLNNSEEYLTNLILSVTDENVSVKDLT